MSRRGIAVVLVATALALTVTTRARATEKLFAAFHIDVDMGTFIMGDERSFGRDVAKGPLNYFDPYFNMWITGGFQIRPHPMVALDFEAGIARWTGVATHSRGSNIFWWSLERVFRVRNYLIPIEVSVIISVMESPKTFLGICIGPGLYIVNRYVEAKYGVDSFGRALGGGGKLTLVLGAKRAGPFEFNFEIGFRITRFAKMKTTDDVDTGDHRPDFSGPFLGLKLLFGGGTSDPAATPEPAPQPAPAPAPQPAPAPAPQPAPMVQPAPAPAVAPVAPIPPSGG